MKVLVTGGAGFLEYGISLGLLKITPREMKHSQNQHKLEGISK